MEHSWISSTVTSRLWLLAIIFLAGNEIVPVEPTPYRDRCPTPCVGDDCPPPPPPPICTYGTYSDSCGRVLCSQGPGQICGRGMFRNAGLCGAGMYCQCGRCFGCSILTMQCFDKTCM